MDDIRYRLLEGIAVELRSRIIPELTSAEARRAAEVSLVFLRHLGVEAADGPGLVGAAQPDLLQAARDLVSVLAERGEGATAAFRGRLDDLSQADVAGDAAGPGAAIDRIGPLRELHADLIRAVGQAEVTAGAERLRESACAEARWSRGVRAIQIQAAALPDAALPDAPSGQDRLTPDVLTGVLRRHFPDDERLRSTEIVAPPAGYSKATVFVTLESDGSLPEKVVLRQDAVVDYFGIGTSVRDEEPVLRMLCDHGLPVPDPVMLEPGETELGPAFMLTKLLPGSLAGLRSTWSAGGTREVVEDVARLLAKLHSVDVSGLPLPNAGDDLGSERFQALVETYADQWRQNVVEPSPITEYALAWLANEARAGGVEARSLVHGDVGPHNMLIQDGRLTGLADWELMHLGDPAEDLAYFRPAAEHLMSFEEFLAVYYEAGGQPVDERRLKIFSVTTNVRNNGYVAACSRRFKDQGKPLPVGAIGFNALRVNEVLIADALDLH